jgi:hypothetical protein
VPSYVKFRDVSAVIQAGQRLASAGEALDSDVRRITGDIQNLENQVLKGTDDYSREFLREYHAATEQGPAVNEALRTNSVKVAQGALDIGNNVVKAAKSYLWVDAVNGAAMFKST